LLLQTGSSAGFPRFLEEAGGILKDIAPERMRGLAGAFMAFYVVFGGWPIV
jgi:hypothetical protein